MAKKKEPEIITYHPGMQERFVRSNVDVAFAGGTLSPQDPESSILTPNGFVKFKDVKVGDEICGIANERQTVVHIDPCGEKDFIRITCEDGSSARSALDHKWWALKDGNEMTVIGFELLESFQLAEERGEPYEISLFKYVDGEAVAVKILRIEDIGRLPAICVGVSNDDELYITDDYLITKNCGKAQPYSAKILTPRGWTTMGSLKEGDIICNVKGGTQKVVRIYEKGVRDCFEIQFAHGSVKCCPEHLWRVFDRIDSKYYTMTAQEMKLMDYRRLSVECPAPVRFSKHEGDDRPLPLTAYTVGRILGKGSFNDPDISPNMVAKMKILGSGDTLRLPERMKFGTIQERKDVLRGLIDEATEDFYPDTLAWIRIGVQTELLEDITTLVHSLGGDVVVLKKLKRYTRILLLLPDADEYYTPNVKMSGKHKRIIRRQVQRIVPCGRENMRCILVSSPDHLYITDDFIPTHNTFAAILSVAEPSLDPFFRAAFTRRNLGNLKQGGGIIDDFERAYGSYVRITKSDQPRVTFPSGAFVDCLHIADETKSKLTERAKGWQYDMFYLDELTSYEFTTFSIVGTRNRGKGKWTGKIRGTTNPKRSHWTRKMLDYYIGYDGFVRKDRDGRVIYFYQMGDTVDDIVFGESKREVYEICKLKIDDQLKKLHGKDWTWENLIRSFVFYAGKTSENKAVNDNNPGYIASVAAAGGKLAEQLIEGNFNVDDDEDDAVPITGKDAMKVFFNDPCVNGDKWITVDLADVGTDNLVALAWNGFHVMDALIIGKSTPRVNYEKIKIFATKHGIPETHIIYDAMHGAYMMDYMPEAVPYNSSASSCGIFMLLADRLKDECYMRLVDMIANQRISFDPIVGKRRYTHKGLSEDHTIQAEFLEECSVVRINETPRGKKKLMTKKEMNAMLGKGRSMDLLDPCAMRMYPVLQYQYGDELDATSQQNQRRRRQDDKDKSSFDIYDGGNWC